MRASLLAMVAAMGLGGCGLFNTQQCDEGFEYWRGNCYLTSQKVVDDAQGGVLTPGVFAQRLNDRFCTALADCGTEMACPDQVDYPSGCGFDVRAARECLASEWACGPDGIPVGPPVCERVFECDTYGYTEEPYTYYNY